MPAISDPQELVKTQTEAVPPPDVTVPEPDATAGVAPDLLREVKALADRVGGLHRLKEIVDRLAALPR
jgi:hypothetical protein